MIPSIKWKRPLILELTCLSNPLSGFQSSFSVDSLSHVQQYLQYESKPSSPVFFIPELEPVCELSELVVESDEALLPDFLRTDDCKSLDMDDLLDAFPLFAVGVAVVLFVLFCKDDTSSCSSSSSLSASLDAT